MRTGLDRPGGPRILALDPGPVRTAWLLLSDGAPCSWAHEPNEMVAALVAGWTLGGHLAVERVRSYGMPVGAEVLETAEWCGAFRALATAAGVPVRWVTRKEVVLHLCGSPRGNDATVRAALIDRYGGKAAAIGTKAQPGPLHGITGDCWSALAIATTTADQLAEGTR